MDHTEKVCKAGTRGRSQTTNPFSVLLQVASRSPNRSAPLELPATFDSSIGLSVPLFPLSKGEAPPNMRKKNWAKHVFLVLKHRSKELSK
ncbi:hypothetical protein CDAR_480721 [Caerostris darwini]|uniref:Uncharacterized protein n=1 Tax=Caerostris darwini TaxID=1538125 RepID=A0AAV4RZP6_9ARAC|nr:hypothetical protein CDAR_480721 [Caerostris darwini]